jgi:UPF0716 protein FxsA
MSPSRRRGWPWAVLAVLFVVVPLTEIYLIVQLGQVIGAWWTILLIIGSGILGSVLVRREGRRAWRALQEALSSGRMPAKELADGALILVGGTLLITPGFLSDVVGLAVILPLTRPLSRRVLARVIGRRMTVMTTGPGRRPGHRQGDDGTDRTGRADRTDRADVVEGEVVEDP